MTRNRRIYVSHNIDGIYACISEPRGDEVIERIYNPSPTSTDRLEDLLIRFTPHHANFTWGHMSATWIIPGSVATCPQREFLSESE